MIKIFVTLLIFFLGNVVQCQAQNSDEVKEVLTNITSQMANLKTVQADFTQEKKMAVFTSPIILRGTLLWEKPDSFAWRIVSPIQYIIVMRQGIARQWEGEHNTIQEFQMSSNPVMRVASSQLQKWFGGNYQKLATEYDVSLAGRQPLILACVPHQDSPESGVIARISIQFREDLRYIERITIEEVSGDITNIKFENTHFNLPISEDSWRIGLVSPHV
ncbi:MAG: outer membrane lipoprotein carrier protein LolA [Candidatus Omnitrophica bacterium]|nr:outer membrane lipoprotein carrier protein LolA [Candidatus Omnitrophota bacterium]